MKQHNQSGRSMIEMLAVVIIIGILTVSAVAGLNQAMDKYRVSKMHTDIMAIDSELVNLYAWQRTYPSGEASIQRLCENEIFPDGCEQEDDAIVARNPYGGTYNIITTPLTKTITATGLPESACNDLLLQEWGQYLNSDINPNPNCNGTIFTITFN